MMFVVPTSLAAWNSILHGKTCHEVSAANSCGASVSLRPLFVLEVAFFFFLGL